MLEYTKATFIRPGSKTNETKVTQISKHLKKKLPFFTSLHDAYLIAEQEKEKTGNISQGYPAEKEVGD